MSTKRYSSWCSNTHGHQLMEHPEGAWVRFEDYEARAQAEYNRGFARGSGDEGAYQRKIARLRARGTRRAGSLGMGRLGYGHRGSPLPRMR